MRSETRREDGCDEGSRSQGVSVGRFGIVFGGTADRTC